jgi:hypothetical protein
VANLFLCYFSSYVLARGHSGGERAQRNDHHRRRIQLCDPPLPGGRPPEVGGGPPGLRLHTVRRTRQLTHPGRPTASA